MSENNIHPRRSSWSSFGGVSINHSSQSAASHHLVQDQHHAEERIHRNSQGESALNLDEGGFRNASTSDQNATRNTFIFHTPREQSLSFPRISHDHINDIQTSRPISQFMHRGGYQDQRLLCHKHPSNIEEMQRTLNLSSDTVYYPVGALQQRSGVDFDYLDTNSSQSLLNKNSQDTHSKKILGNSMRRKSISISDNGVDMSTPNNVQHFVQQISPVSGIEKEKSHEQFNSSSSGVLSPNDNHRQRDHQTSAGVVMEPSLSSMENNLVGMNRSRMSGDSNQPLRSSPTSQVRGKVNQRRFPTHLWDKKNECVWMSQYEALKAFFKMHNHSNVPIHYEPNKRLGHWVNSQRQLYRKHKCGMITSMTEDRIGLLEKLEFVWSLEKNAKINTTRVRPSPTEFQMTDQEQDHCTTSDTKPNLCAHSKRDFSNKNESLSSSIDKDLPIVTNAQRKKRKKEQNYHHPILSSVTDEDNESRTSQDIVTNDAPDPIKLNLGADKSVRTTTITKATNKDESFFSSIESATNSPKHESGKTIDIDESIEESIEHSEINMRPSPSMADLPSSLQNNPLWTKHLRDLLEFKETYGHCNVPFQYSPNKSLGYWVHNQRQLFKKWCNGISCSLTKDRVDSLLKMGLNLRSGVKEEHGEKIDSEKSNTHHKDREKSKNSCNSSIPGKNKDAEVLEVEERNPSSCLISPTLSSETNSSIDTKRLMKNEGFDTAWYRRLRELYEYKKQVGNCDVPSVYSKNRSLGTWVMNQRQQYRKFCSGEKSSITEERITALEQVGFRWYVGKGMRSKEAATTKNEDEGANEFERSEETTISELVIINSQKEFQLKQISIGTELAVFWDADKKFYHAKVTKFHQGGNNTLTDSIFTIEYEDGDTETLNLAAIPFKITSTGKLEKRIINTSKRPDDKIISEEAAHSRDLLSLSLFDRHVINHISSYLPTIRDLISFSSLTKVTLDLMTDSHYYEPLLEALYKQSLYFGQYLVADGSNSFWKNKWKEMYRLRHDLRYLHKQVQHYRQKKVGKFDECLGILSQAEEFQTITSDNSMSNPNSECDASLGCIGMLHFTAKLSPHDEDTSTSRCMRNSQVAIWGGFNGLRIHSETIFSLNGAASKKSHSIFHIVGENAGRILSVVSSPALQEHDSSTDSKSKGSLKPCLFAASSSGAVIAIVIVPCVEGHRFKISSFAMAHRTVASNRVRVSALSFLHDSKHFLSPSLLMSGGDDGRVYLYPKALSSRFQYELNDQILCCSNDSGSPILSLASLKHTLCHGNDMSQIFLLFTGDADGKITVWGVEITITTGVFLDNVVQGYDVNDFSKFKCLQIHEPSVPGLTVTHLRTLQNGTLLSGYSSGQVKVWETKWKSTRLDSIVQLMHRHTIPVVIGGPITSLETFGSTLLTAGVNDFGLMRGWDLENGELIGCVQCHHGKLVAETSKNPTIEQQCVNKFLHSPVVGQYIKNDGVLLSLCRDGSAHSWNYVHDPSHLDGKDETNLKQKWTIDDDIITAAVMLTLSSKDAGRIIYPESELFSATRKLEELKQLMAINNDDEDSMQHTKELKNQIRISIIQAACKNATDSRGTVCPEASFVAANNNQYAYIKKAFDELSGIRPCVKCTIVSKSAYECRLKLLHPSTGQLDIRKNSNSPKCTQSLDDKTEPLHKTNMIGVGYHVKLEKEDPQCILQLEGRGNYQPTLSNPSADLQSMIVFRDGISPIDTTAMSYDSPLLCGFCQYKNERSAKICAMCHEPITDCNANQSNEKIVRSLDDLHYEPILHRKKLQSQIHIGSWRCHNAKCLSMNLAKNKRCKKCFAWKGGKRTANCRKTKSRMYD